MASNKDEYFETYWKPGGTLLGVSERWASRAESGGSDHLGGELDRIKGGEVN